MVEKKKQHKYVLVAVTYDLKFVYVLAGWEGTAHDSCILTNALSRPQGMNIPEGIDYSIFSIKFIPYFLETC